MPFSFRELFFRRSKFCCCIPVRVGVIIMAVLGITFSAVLSVALWYQVTVNHTMSPGIRAAFVISGLVETFLFAASIFGLVGAIVEKLSFTRIYANITYVHFLLNLGVAVWFLVVVIQTVDNADSHLCNGAGAAEAQCLSLTSFGKTIYIVLALLVLIIELYGALIVTRYVWQLSREKTYKRQTRQGIEEAFRLEAARIRYYTLASSHEVDHLDYPLYEDANVREYDPYREARIPPPNHSVQIPRGFQTFMDRDRPATPVEVGYGGGSWTHKEISDEEKARMRRLEGEQVPDAMEADELPRYPEL